MQEMWLQQDGASPHFGRQVTAILKAGRTDSRVQLLGHQGHLPELLLTTIFGDICSPWRMQWITRTKLRNCIMDVSMHMRDNIPYEVCYFTFIEGHNLHRQSGR